MSETIVGFQCLKRMHYVPEYSPGTDLKYCGKKLLEYTIDICLEQAWLESWWVYRLLTWWKPSWFRDLLRQFEVDIPRFRKGLLSLRKEIEDPAAVEVPLADRDVAVFSIFIAVFLKVYMIACNVAGLQPTAEGTLPIKSWHDPQQFLFEVQKRVEKLLGIDRRWRRLYVGVQKKWNAVLQSLQRIAGFILPNVKGHGGQ